MADLADLADLVNLASVKNTAQVYQVFLLCRTTPCGRMWGIEFVLLNTKGKKTMGKLTQQTFEGHKRLSIDAPANLIRMAKSKAALQGVSLKWVVITLLTGWVNGTIKLIGNQKDGDK